MNERLRKWAALAVLLVGLLASGAALGQDPEPCQGVYLESGLTEQQLTFEEFRVFYAETLCATDDLQARRDGHVPAEAR